MHGNADARVTFSERPVGREWGERSGRGKGERFFHIQLRSQGREFGKSWFMVASQILCTKEGN